MQVLDNVIFHVPTFTMLTAEAAPKLPTDLLGPYPILQFTAALIVLMFVAIGGMLYLRGKASVPEPISAPKSPENAVQLFFDGPLKAIFDILREIHSRQAINRMEVRDEIASALSGMRQQLEHKIDNARAEIKAEINAVRSDLDQKHGANYGLLNRIDGKLDGRDH